MALFVDTWGWLVLADRVDPRHQQVVEIYEDVRRARRPVITTDYVIDETLTLLFRRTAFGQAAAFGTALMTGFRLGQIRLEPITEARFRASWRLRLRYRDKPAISFTDLTSFVVMRELKIRDVLSEDQDFQRANLGFRRLP